MKLLLVEAVNYDFYKEKIDVELFNWLVGLDPTTDKKYSRWIIQWFFKEYLDPFVNKINTNSDVKIFNPISLSRIKELLGTMHFHNMFRAFDMFLSEDYSKITADLKNYDLLKRKKLLQSEELYNIMNIKGAIGLYKVVSSYADKLQQLEFDSIGNDEYDKWFEDNEWLVVSPNTEKAACKYGANTRWCTASRDNNYFEYYSEKGPLIIIINKIKNEKFQLHFESYQWMDAKDNQIGNREEFKNSLPSEVKLAIYNNTHNILFDPDIKTRIFTAIKNPKFLKRFGNTIDCNDIENLYSETSDTPFSLETYKWAISDNLEEDSDYSSAYHDGYSEPWAYIEEEPELADTVSTEDKASNRYWKHDEDLYSEEQKEQAGQEAEASAIDYETERIARDFVNNNYGYNFIKNFRHKIWDACVTILIESADTKQDELYLLIVALLGLDQENYYTSEHVIKVLETYEV